MKRKEKNNKIEKIERINETFKVLIILKNKWVTWIIIVYVIFKNKQKIFKFLIENKINIAFFSFLSCDIDSFRNKKPITD